MRADRARSTQSYWSTLIIGTILHRVTDKTHQPTLRMTIRKTEPSPHRLVRETLRVFESACVASPLVTEAIADSKLFESVQHYYF